MSSDFATLTNDLILLDRLLNSQIHEFSHTFILKDHTSQIDGIWGFDASILMGDKVEPRKEWIEENVDFTLEDSYEMLK